MVTSKIQWSRRSRKQSICFTFVENSIKPLDLPLILNYRYTCKNKFTEQLQNFICSPCILFPYDMLHLFKIINKSMHFINSKSQHREKRSRNQQLLTKTWRITLILAIASWPACKNWLISLHICFSWISLLFCSSLIREIARFRHVLLQDEKHHVY